MTDGSTAYDAFGAVRSQTGTGSVLGYTGELYTPATGLLHLRARDLNLTLGRFLSTDSVQSNALGSQGITLYAYVANNPSTWIDPSAYSVELLAAALALSYTICCVVAPSLGYAY